MQYYTLSYTHLLYGSRPVHTHTPRSCLILTIVDTRVIFMIYPIDMYSTGNTGQVVLVMFEDVKLRP